VAEESTSSEVGVKQLKKAEVSQPRDYDRVHSAGIPSTAEDGKHSCSSSNALLLFLLFLVGG
jgi:hypothetical protein